VEGNKAATRTSPRRPNHSQTGAQSETTTVPSASSTKESMTSSPPDHNQQTQDDGNNDSANSAVPTASSPKESMTTSPPGHNQQTQDDGNNVIANSASTAVPLDVSGSNSPENIDKRGDGTVHDNSPTGNAPSGNVLQVNHNVGQNTLGIVNQETSDVQQTDDHPAVQQGINCQFFVLKNAGTTGVNGKYQRISNHTFSSVDNPSLFKIYREDGQWSLSYKNMILYTNQNAFGDDPPRDGWSRTKAGIESCPYLYHW
jgi:hypothetical protein